MNNKNNYDIFHRGIVYILCACLLVATFSLGGCKTVNETREQNLRMKSDLERIFIDICAIPRTPSAGEEINQFVTNKLSEYGVAFTQDDGGNIIADLPATIGYEKSQQTILECHMRSDIVWSSSTIRDNSEDGVQPYIDDKTDEITANGTSLGASSGMGMTTALYVLDHSENHGPVKVIFLNATAESIGSAALIDDSVFANASYIVSLDGYDADNIYTHTASTRTMFAQLGITRHENTGLNAYVLNASHFLGGNAGISALEERGNPVSMIAEFLANVKAAGIMYELCSFDAEASESYIPKEARAIVSVNDYEAKKLNSMWEDTVKEYEKTHRNSEPLAAFDIAQTEPPATSLDSDTTGKVVTFLYSIPTGAYGDELLHAAIGISSVDLGIDSFGAHIGSDAGSRQTINEISDLVRGAASISDFEVTTGMLHEGYQIDEGLRLPNLISSAYVTNFNKSPEMLFYPEMSVFTEWTKKNEDLQMVIIGFDISNEGTLTEALSVSTLDNSAKVLLTFLMEI
ncbi:MAG: hypothetical protein LBN22_09085 [Clostridiales Family XIII bacterium]|jgi:dipeptidase D|nr:hypothetical protein [Clostridiales Family XIII bacterium]